MGEPHLMDVLDAVQHLSENLPSHPWTEVLVPQALQIGVEGSALTNLHHQIHLVLGWGGLPVSGPLGRGTTLRRWGGSSG